MSKVIELRSHKSDIVVKMEELLDVAEKEERDFTEEEEKRYNDFEKSLDEADVSIKAEEKKEARAEKLKEERELLTNSSRGGGKTCFHCGCLEETASGGDRGDDD